MDNDGKNNARRWSRGYLGDDHCSEHGHGCQEYWCGNGMRPLPSKETNEEREHLDAVMNGEEDGA